MLSFLSKILVFVIVFQTFNDTWVVEFFGENILKITIFLFTIFSLKSFFNITKVPNYKSIIFFCMTMLISSFANFDRLGSPVQSFSTPLIVLIYYFIFSQYKEIKWLILFVVISALFSSIYCLTRDEVLTEYTFRKTGGMGDPNEFSTTILFVFGLLWAYYITTKKKLIIVILISFLFLSSLLAAGSKTASLVFVIYLFTIVYKLISKSNILQKIKYFLFISISIILVSYVFYINNGELIYLFLERFESSKTANLRIDNWNKGFVFFKNNWLFGVGTNNYSFIMDNNFQFDEGASETHNMYLKVLFENGILGLTPFVLILINQLKHITHNKNNHVVMLIALSYLLMGFSLSLSYDKYVWLIIALSNNFNFINFFNLNKNENSPIYT